MKGRELLRVWMKKVGASNAGLARSVGVTRASVSGWVRGACVPSLGPALRLAEITGGYVPVEAWTRSP